VYGRVMQRGVPPALALSVVMSGVVGLWGTTSEVFWVAVVFTPLTTALLFAVLGRPNSPLRRKLALGLVFSLVGDVALLGKEGIWFQAGLAAFLVTHVCYVAALFPYTVRRWRTAAIAVLATSASVGTVVWAYPQAEIAGVGLALVVYAAALTATVVVASATLGGALTKAVHAAVGATLFYLADACLALEAFVPSVALPWAPLFTTGVYWIGQYNIAVAGRWGDTQSK
jgi:alkenylglycerophosphocholine hydrolase